MKKYNQTAATRCIAASEQRHQRIVLYVTPSPTTESNLLVLDLAAEILLGFHHNIISFKMNYSKHYIQHLQHTKYLLVRESEF